LIYKICLNTTKFIKTFIVNNYNINNIFIHILFRTTSIPLGNRSVVGHDEKHLTIWDSRPDNSSWDVSIYQVTMTNFYSIIVCFVNSNKIRLLGAWNATSRYKTRKYFLLHIFWIEMTGRTIQFLTIFNSSKITLFKWCTCPTYLPLASSTFPWHQFFNKFYLDKKLFVFKILQ
jgi:hypothetical protein